MAASRSLYATPPPGRGASWGEDGNIIAALNTRRGLSQVPSGGGNAGSRHGVGTGRGLPQMAARPARRQVRFVHGQPA